MKSIYVGNLASDASEDQLQTLFSEHGAVKRVVIVKDRFTGESRGFGFVDMENDGEAMNAIQAVNGKELNGRALKVNEARPQAAKPQGGRGGGRPRGGRGPRGGSGE
ncbi:MAG: RNA-binding protein [Acidobacteriia bacterium]|nr:RNA-binding protein [Terriglobia bacterium]